MDAYTKGLEDENRFLAEQLGVMAKRLRKQSERILQIGYEKNQLKKQLADYEDREHGRDDYDEEN